MSWSPLALRLRYRLAGRARDGLIEQAAQIPNWRSPDEAAELLRLSYFSPDRAQIVEIGAFLGSGTVLLAGARRLRGNGHVHSVDPFDASGDTFSAPIYRDIASHETRSLRERFDDNLSRAGLAPWVTVHQGTAESVASNWRDPVDLLLLDADQSPAGALAAFRAWAPFLRPGAMVALTNASDRDYEPDHDGNRLVVVDAMRQPEFEAPYYVGTHAFVRRASL